jgi:hypothetical protein
LLADLQKERGFPHPSRKKKLLKFKRESTRLETLHKNKDDILALAIMDQKNVVSGHIVS